MRLGNDLHFLGIVCREKVIVPKSKPYISFIGKRNQRARPVIVWNDKASDRGSNGQLLGTYASATVGVESDYFCATNLIIKVMVTYLMHLKCETMFQWPHYVQECELYNCVLGPLFF